jgi:GntR family transcriptional regulator
VTRVAKGPESAYTVLASELRRALLKGRYAGGQRLPTEAELAAKHRVSRQTVRRAMQDLVAEGMIYRIRGRGTFPSTGGGQYLRQFGSVEDLMALSRDTRFELLSPLERKIDTAAAGRLRLPSDVVSVVRFMRLHDEMPLCVTTVYLPPHVGRAIEDVPALTAPGVITSITVLGLIDQRLEHPVVESEQSITVAPAPAYADVLGCPEGRALLRIDRVYFDARETPVELAVSWFHPDRYSYRVRLRRSHS